MNSSVGEQLRSAREAKHLSLEQAAQSTFIKIKFLEALENDRREELLTSVQARGFLRMYADLLGLPVGPLFDIWDGKVVSEDAPQAAELPQELPHELPIPTSPAEFLPELEPFANSSPEPSFPDDRFILDESLLSTESAPALVQPVEFASADVPATSAEVFREIGSVLRRRREDLKITHADIEKFVHIRPKYLEALEEGRLDDLPSTVQGRGMLTNYAHFLEVDTSALQTRFAEGLQLRRLELNPLPAAVNKNTRPRPASSTANPPAQKEGKQPSLLKRTLTPDLLIAGTAIILLFGFALWSTFQIISMHENDGSENAQAPNISQVLLETSSLPQGTTTAEVTLEPTSAMAQEATQQSATQQAVTGPESTVPVKSDQPLNVYVVARQNAWLQVTVGKSVVFNGRVVPGNAYPFSGNERIELITGNAGALQVFYNDHDLGSLGLTGQVANLIFTLDGIVTPTPRFSPTPTITQPATLTPQATSTPAPATVTPLIPKK